MTSNAYACSIDAGDHRSTVANLVESSALVFSGKITKVTKKGFDLPWKSNEYTRTYYFDVKEVWKGEELVDSGKIAIYDELNSCNKWGIGELDKITGKNAEIIVFVKYINGELYRDYKVDLFGIKFNEEIDSKGSEKQLRKELGEPKVKY
jgi:hypothetical protein